MYFGFVLYSSQGVYYLYTEGNKEIQWSEDIKFSLKWKLLFLKNENFKDYEISTEFQLERNINWNTDVKKKKKGNWLFPISLWRPGNVIKNWNN